MDPDACSSDALCHVLLQVSTENNKALNKVLKRHGTRREKSKLTLVAEVKSETADVLLALESTNDPLSVMRKLRTKTPLLLNFILKEELVAQARSAMLKMGAGTWKSSGCADEFRLLLVQHAFPPYIPTKQFIYASEVYEPPDEPELPSDPPPTEAMRESLEVFNSDAPFIIRGADNDMERYLASQLFSSVLFTSR